MDAGSPDSGTAPPSDGGVFSDAGGGEDGGMMAGYQYPPNPGCSDFPPICETPEDVPWPEEEIWTANAPDVGMVRVMEGTYDNFQDWNAANTSFDNSSCVGPSMRDCCLVLEQEYDGMDSCPVPYNDQVLTVVEGDRLTVRLPPSPCDENDTAPVSGYSKVTAESVQAHQIGICQESSKA